MGLRKRYDTKTKSYKIHSHFAQRFVLNQAAYNGVQLLVGHVFGPPKGPRVPGARLRPAGGGGAPAGLREPLALGLCGLDGGRGQRDLERPEPDGVHHRGRPQRIRGDREALHRDSQRELDLLGFSTIGEFG